MVRPLNAATDASTKPDSFSVSVWIATCTSMRSATARQLSIFAGDDLGARADRDGDRRLDVGVAGLADLPDAAVFQAEIGLHDPPVIDDERIRDHRVGGVLRCALALPHAVADHLAAAELHLLAVGGEVLLYLGPQFGVSEPHLVADRRAEHFRVSLASDFHFTFPITLP